MGRSAKLRNRDDGTNYSSVIVPAPIDQRFLNDLVRFTGRGVGTFLVDIALLVCSFVLFVSKGTLNGSERNAPSNGGVPVLGNASRACLSRRLHFFHLIDRDCVIRALRRSITVKGVDPFNAPEAIIPSPPNTVRSARIYEA